MVVSEHVSPILLKHTTLIWKMFLLYVFFLSQTQVFSNNVFNLYSTNYYQDDHCLLYYVRDNIIHFSQDNKLAHQIISYCFRSLEKNLLDENLTNTIDPHLTFVQLHKKNTSSQQLLSWSASIDLAEEYEIFLNNIPHSLSLSENEIVFYNCTLPWFGPFCRFAFDLELDQSFDEIVSLNFKSRWKLAKDVELPCYSYLNCETSLPCLDWRHICNNHRDCFDGSDEVHCWQLEMNECLENEYRCHNGQCIPEEFFLDSILNSDCLDRTDEYEMDYDRRCLSDPAFRCEEHMCHPGPRKHPCGDGQCQYERDRCDNGRRYLSLNDPCSIAVACYMNHIHLLDLERCQECIGNITCIKTRCPPEFEFPSGPFLLGHVRFIYTNRDFQPNRFSLPDYICYNEQLCADFLPATIRINGSACRHLNEFELSTGQTTSLAGLTAAIRGHFQTCLVVVVNATKTCHNSTMYQCENSTKCISKHRLVDGIRDCVFDDDERFNQSCSLNDVHNRRRCLVNGNEKCFAPVVLINRQITCDNKEVQLDREDIFIENHISFQTQCDGFQELLPVIIDGESVTDETECEHWPCNNTNTRCDNIWSCQNGSDELNCPSSPCPEMQYDCIFYNDTSKVSCISSDRVGDGKVDCFGGSDEREFCRIHAKVDPTARFLCLGEHFAECIRTSQLCDPYRRCKPFEDHERFCMDSKYGYKVCNNDWPLPRTSVENLICNLRDTKASIKYFKIRNIPNYPLQITMNDASLISSFKPVIIPTIQSDSIVSTRDAGEWWRCHRGLSIYVRMKDNNIQLFCLCPPSYFGDQCQYQNQRVSLTLQIRVLLHWRTVFIFLITLIDDQRNIESHDYIEYLSIRDCDTKFNVYLLYSTRPKNPSKNYSVQIDSYNRMTLDYQASWIYPLQFPFLPVHRLPIHLKVPLDNSIPQEKCTLPCINGQCFNYINNQNAMFCRCHPDWSGVQCNIKQKCHCAIGSLCIDGSICLCPLDRFGPRCYLRRPACHSTSCTNGLCVPYDERHFSVDSRKSLCVCPEQYSGDRCERQQTQINVQLHPSFSIPPKLFIHLISARNDLEPLRTSLMKKIGFDQNSVSFYTSIPFNIAFAEMFDHYYLIIIQEENIISATISTSILPSHRCVSIQELFNETIANQYLLKRIKLYHIPCRERLELICFYDEVHLCLCDLARQANCFEFDHHMTYNCQGYNLCDNDGECFQDKTACTTSAICVCRDCYYGSRCQFSTKGSSLSLDIIISYGIRQKIPINEQSLVVKIAITITMTIFGLGSVNSVLSLMTFHTKKSRDVGCGLYLFTSSIVSLITISMLTMKFWILLLVQMGSIKNRLFIEMQCISIDFLLRVLVSVGDWLNACIAIERAITVSKGASFDKQKSKQYAKWMIFIVFLFTICTHLHDPIHRSWNDDIEEQHSLCLTKYSTFLQIFDQISNVIHFSIPFGINCISALVVIIVAARTRSVAQKKQSYTKHLHEQFKQHKHLLVSPFVLILLASPRLIISFLFGCMKSARNPWLYMIGYYISFIPSIMTFVIFVLPSKSYKTQFKESIKRFKLTWFC